MNTTKTKYMKDRNKNGDPRVSPVDGAELEEVNEFVYLGLLVTTDNDTSKEIKKSRLLWITKNPDIRSSATQHEANDVQNTDQTSSPLQPRDLDNAARGRTSPWSTDGRKCVAKVHEP